MKKSLLVPVVLAALSLSGAATALDVSTSRCLHVQGLGGQSLDLGTLEFLALGVDGGHCDYLVTWANPFNPNDVMTCLVSERRTPFAPSCFENEQEDIRGAQILGGAEVSPGGFDCVGFDPQGIPHDVNLHLIAVPGGLEGVVFMSDDVPVIYPVLVTPGGC